MKHITYIFSVTAATLIACILSTMGLSAKNRTGLSPAASVECLIERICPGASKHFFIQIDTSATESYFELAQGSDNRIIISADCPINAATGLNWYLKYYAGIHLSWNCMRAELPAELPPVPVPERRTTRSQYRYYLNYCTFSYSMAFWDWARWEQELDWMTHCGSTSCTASDTPVPMPRTS